MSSAGKTRLPPIATLGLRHLALRVRDLERARAFYCDVFGMRVVWEPDPDNVYLTSGTDNLALHRVSGEIAGGAHQPLDHIGFLVSSADAVTAAEQALRAHGVPIVQAARRHRDGSTSVYCTDPEGNTVQIIHIPEIEA